MGARREGEERPQGERERQGRKGPAAKLVMVSVSADPRPEEPRSPAGSPAESPAAPPPSWRETLVALRWPLAAVATVAVLSLFGYLIYRETLRGVERAGAAVGDAASRAVGAAERVARGFLTGDVTETFVAWIPRVEGTDGGRLEVATAQAVETMRRTDERWIFWEQLSLGVTVSEVRVPVTYRYHLRLADPWKVVVEGHVALVHAPALRPSLPPAIDTRGIERHVEEGWLRFDSAERLAELERSITPTLIRFAHDRRYLDLVREESRRSVAEFVRRWLVDHDQWRREGVVAIKVVFPDEETIDPESVPPTVELDD